MQKILIVAVVAIISVFGFDLLTNRGAQTEDLDAEIASEEEELTTLDLDEEDGVTEDDLTDNTEDDSTDTQEEDSSIAEAPVKDTDVGSSVPNDSAISSVAAVDLAGGAAIQTMTPEQRAELNDILLELSQVLVEMNATLALLAEQIEAMEAQTETV